MFSLDNFKRNELEVVAGKFEDVSDIGDIVQLILETETVNRISVVRSPLNPQLEETTTITSIHFVSSGHSYYMFEGEDYLIFTTDDEGRYICYTMNEEEFLNNFTIVSDEIDNEG